MNYQDMLAEIGAGIAHPGGASVTDTWAKSVPWRRDGRILDVGCGTGKTLIDLCQRHECHGTGIDVRPKMIAKAHERARTGGTTDVQFEVASAESLPFPDAVFDLVYSESVNVFLPDPVQALREYRRVLRPGGTYVDVEMMVLQPVSEGWRTEVKQVYGAKHVPDLRGWKRHYEQAGFTDVRALLTKSVNPFDMAAQAGESAREPVDLVTPGAFDNKEVLAGLEANARWLERNHGPLGYGVFIASRPSE